MKKLLVGLSLFLSLVLFSACGVKESFEPETVQINVVGVLKEQNLKDKESGTHFLIDDSGKKTAVRSLTLNLSGADYLNNTVSATGIMNQSDNVLEITGVSVVKVSEKSSDKIEKLEFSNAELGIKLSYFADWKLENSNGSVAFTAPLENEAKSPSVLTISEKHFNYDAENLLNGKSVSPLEAYFIQENNGKEFDKSSIVKIGLEQIDAMKTSDSEKINYVVYKSGVVCLLEFVYANPINADDQKLNEMLKDFSFLTDPEDKLEDEDSTSQGEVSAPPKIDMTMTPYESLPYQFSGQYPSKWYYAGIKSSSNDEVLHHYSFSDSVLDGKNEIISLDVLSGSIPSGSSKLSFAGKNFDVFEKADAYTVYTAFSNRNFRVSGPLLYKDLILYMASTIGPVSNS